LARLKTALVALVLLGASPAAAGPIDRWNKEIARASARFAIPEEWIRRVMIAESGGQAFSSGRPTVSRAGAMGLMQLMPETWLEMRDRLGLGPDPFDPHDNILAGAGYLRSMYDRFGYPGLFAAYNSGPSRYSEFLAGERPLPSETRAYVAAVTFASHDAFPPPKVPAALFAVRTGDHQGGRDEARSAPQSRLFIEVGDADRD